MKAAAVWIVSLVFLFHGSGSLGSWFLSFIKNLGFEKKKVELDYIVHAFREVEEMLVVGMVPEAERWESFRSLIQPWGELSWNCLKTLRNSGAPVLPTLRRLRALASEQRLAVADSQAKSSQAFSQAVACLCLVPILGISLYCLLPGLDAFLFSWILGCSFALVLSGSGSLWLFQLAEFARWGGLPKDQRLWLLISQCAGEEFLALIRSGIPPDLAWIQMCERLSKEAPELGAAWGSSIWILSVSPPSVVSKSTQIILDLGIAIKKSVQLSLMEGRPCLERVEASLQSMRNDVKSQIERELNQLPTRALKPLFVCVAPSLLGLLCFGLWLISAELMANGL